MYVASTDSAGRGSHLNLRLVGRIAERGEGNPHLECPAVRSDLRRRVELEVGREVGAACRFGVDAVGLDPARIRTEEGRRRAVVLRVDVDLHEVLIAEDAIARDERRAQLGGVRVTAAECDENLPRAERDPRRRRHGRLHVVAGHELVELIDPQCLRPDRIGQIAIEREARHRARQIHRRGFESRENEHCQDAERFHITPNQAFAS